MLLIGFYITELNVLYIIKVCVLWYRISVEGLVWLLRLTKETEPLSCWCLETTSTVPPKAMCPIIVPTLLLHKVSYSHTSHTYSNKHNFHPSCN